MNNPTIDGVSLLPCPFCGCEVQKITGFDYYRIYGEHAQGCVFLDDDPIITDATTWNKRVPAVEPTNELREHCKQCAEVVKTWPEWKQNCLGGAPAVERQELVEKVDHPNFLEFAICDTCAAESMCCEIAPNEHLCGGCYWAPINEKAHHDQVAALQSTIAQLQARVQELESGKGEIIHQVRTHGSDCWEDISGESLELCQCDPEEYEIRKLFPSPQAPVAVEEQQAFANWTHEVIGMRGLAKVQRRDEMTVEQEKFALKGWLARAALDATAELNGDKDGR